MMKTILLLLIIATLCPGMDTNFEFFREVDSGFEIKFKSRETAFVHNTSSLNFRVMINLGGKPCKTTLDEAGKEYALKNLIQASESVTHGQFVSPQQTFVVKFPPGYTKNNFPRRVFITIIYRSVTDEDDGTLRLSKIEKKEIEVINTAAQNSQ